MGLHGVEVRFKVHGFKKDSKFVVRGLVKGVGVWGLGEVLGSLFAVICCGVPKTLNPTPLNP